MHLCTVSRMASAKDILALKPGQSIQPQASFDVASMLAKKLYNLEIKSIKDLDGYLDKNFHITVYFNNSGFIKQKLFLSLYNIGRG